MSERTGRDPFSAVSDVRSGGSALFFLLGCVISVVVVAAFLVLFVDFRGEDTGDEPLLAPVTRDLFQHVVLEDGEIESSNSVDIRCEIRARAGSGPAGPSTVILEVIPEGSLVEKGDWLVTLDSSILEQEKRTEQITLNTFEANMIEAKASYDLALITKEEFLTGGLDRIHINPAEDDRRIRRSSPSSASDSPQSRTGASGGSSAAGRSAAQGNSPARTTSSTPAARSSTQSDPSAEASTPPTTRAPAQNSSNAWGDQPVETGPVPLVNPSYGELKRFIENEIFLADDGLKKAQLSFDSIKRMVVRGLVDESQLEGARFRVDAAQNVMDLAKQKLAALEDYTRKRMLVQLESSFQVAELSYRSELSSYEEQLAKVKEIDDQIAKCRVVAPVAGQVVYKNVQSSRAESEFVVEPGAPVRENQVIITLPDPALMQVKAGVDESRISLVKEGMPASVRVDAFGSMLRGIVTKVNPYAEATRGWDSTAKQYLTFIRLLDLPPNIRVGLTAEVKILVEERPNALQMPFQTAYEHDGNMFCLVKSGDRWETKRIVISSTNETMVVLDESASEPLREGDLVVMNPIKHLDLFDHSRFAREESPARGENAPPGPEKVNRDKVSGRTAGSTPQPGV